MGNDPHPARVHAVVVAQQPGRDPRHHHDAATPRGELPNQHPGDRFGLREERVERSHDRLRAGLHEVEDPSTPIAGIESKLMLQADHIAGPLVGDFRGEPVGIGATVVDHVGHPRITGRDRGKPLDGGDRGDGPAGGQIDRISGVFGERGQAARFRRIRRDKQRTNVGPHRTPPGWMARPEARGGRAQPLFCDHAGQSGQQHFIATDTPRCTMDQRSIQRITDRAFPGCSSGTQLAAFPTRKAARRVSDVWRFCKDQGASIKSVHRQASGDRLNTPAPGVPAILRAL